MEKLKLHLGAGYIEKPYTPYTYLLGWTSLNLWYYGVRWAKNCHPSEFMHRYKSSSKIVHQMVKDGLIPDVSQIRQIFSNAKAALKWEEKVIRRMHAVDDDRWLNLQNAGKYFKNKGYISEEQRQRIIECNTGKKKSDETKLKISNSKKGKKLNFTPEAHQEMSKKRSGKGNNNYGKHWSDEIKSILRAKSAARIITDEWKLNMKKGALSRPKISCIYCKRVLDPGNFAQHHGNKCKLNPENNI